MLSYRHSFHAGNFADIIKHIVLVEILDHLRQKEAPFDYIDTHSGAGLYNLNSGHATKLDEFAGGIGKLIPADFPELAGYFAVVNAYNKHAGFNVYPGSPAIANYFLRPQDRAWLYELHPQDYKLLCSNMNSNICSRTGNKSGKSKIRIYCQDGLKGMLALLPPASRRGFILIDPSYEMKSEYDHVFETTTNAYNKFSTGIYAVWYPVVDRRRIGILENKFTQSGIKNIQRFELGLAADTKGRGMTSAGLFVINPPWKLFDRMSDLLPRLALLLGKQHDHFSKCDIISGE